MRQRWSRPLAFLTLCAVATAVAPAPVIACDDMAECCPMAMAASPSLQADGTMDCCALSGPSSEPAAPAPVPATSLQTEGMAGPLPPAAVPSVHPGPSRAAAAGRLADGPADPTPVALFTLYSRLLR